MFTCNKPNERLAEVLRKLPDAMRENACIQREHREAGVAKRRIRNALIIRTAGQKAKLSAKRRADIANGRAGVDPATLAEADRMRAEWSKEPDWRCGYCGKSADTADRCADHVKPLSLGGKHVPENLKRACRSCNSRKGTRTVWFA